MPKGKNYYTTVNSLRGTTLTKDVYHAPFNRSKCLRWMRDHVEEYVNECGEANSTKLAESYAAEADPNNTWLNDEAHPVWEIAAKVAEEYNEGGN